MIIGITGAFGSGKSEAANFFSSRGFEKVLLSSFLEKDLERRGVKHITRKMLQDLGNEWRKNLGAGVLAKKALEYISKKNYRKVVIDGIRNIGEIAELRKKDNFVLIAILANRKMRFERLKQIKRREDLTWKTFESLDFRDLGIGEKKTGLQVAFCIALSDVFVTNNRTKEYLEKKLGAFIKSV